MENTNEILERYYRGESTLEEERQLRAASQAGKLPDEPMLTFGGRPAELPHELMERIQRDIHTRANRRLRNLRIALCSTAAMLLLIICLRGMFSPSNVNNIQLSDNIKKERFKNALRVIGQVLEEKTPPVQKVLYEDNKLIIAIE